MFVGIEFYFS